MKRGMERRIALGICLATISCKETDLSGHFLGLNDEATRMILNREQGDKYSVKVFRKKGDEVLAVGNRAGNLISATVGLFQLTLEFSDDKTNVTGHFPSGKKLFLRVPREVFDKAVKAVVEDLDEGDAISKLRDKRRARTTEATRNIRKLFDSSVYYYEEEGPGKWRQFPATTDWTPPGSPCSSSGDHWLPNSKLWDHPTWKALVFSVEEPHYYSYQYVSAGTGTSASFSARARGDLNCDGTFSLFERVGKVDQYGNVQGGSGLYKYLPLE